MRGFLRAMVVTTLLVCGTPALAGEAVTLTGRVTGVRQYPKTQTICLIFTSGDKKDFMICDDVTAKDRIEELFALGKKDQSCRIEAMVTKTADRETYLKVTRVTTGD